MRMQIKWRGGVLFGFIFSLLLSGCSGGGSSTPEAVTAPPAGPVAWNEVEGLHGIWIGTSSNGRAIWGAVVDDKFYLWYSAIGDPTMLRGGITGSFDFDSGEIRNGVLRAINTFDFTMDDRTVYIAELIGKYVPKQTLTGTMYLRQGGSVSFSLTYVSDSGTKVGDPGPIGVANFADIIGTYDGQSIYIGTGRPMVTIAPDGALHIQGYLDGFSGHNWETTQCPTTDGHINTQYWGATVYQLRLTIGCLFPARDVTGAALFDPTTRQLFLFAWRGNPGEPLQAFIHTITKRP